MRATPYAAVIALLLALFAAPAQAQTCTSPWTPDHDYYAAFEPGNFYRSPYNEVIEVLAKLCVSYDEIRSEDGGDATRVCGAERLAIRNVIGRGLPARPLYQVVYFDGIRFGFATSHIDPAEWVGSWGKLPASCYRRSVVIAAEDGNLVFPRLVPSAP